MKSKAYVALRVENNLLVCIIIAKITSLLLINSFEQKIDVIWKAGEG